MLQVLRLDAQMQKLAEELKHESSLLVFGRGYNYATALEAALKVGPANLSQSHLNKCSIRVLLTGFITRAFIGHLNAIYQGLQNILLVKAVASGSVTLQYVWSDGKL